MAQSTTAQYLSAPQKKKSTSPAEVCALRAGALQQPAKCVASAPPAVGRGSEVGLAPHPVRVLGF